jgi:hypothetical protein
MASTLRSRSVTSLLHLRHLLIRIRTSLPRRLPLAHPLPMIMVMPTAIPVSMAMRRASYSPSTYRPGTAVVDAAVVTAAGIVTRALI